MKTFIEHLERMIEGCESLGGMEREKAVYQSILKEYRKQCNLQNVNARTLGFASCASLAKSMPLDQAIQIIKSDITGLPQTAKIDGELVVQYVR